MRSFLRLRSVSAYFGFNSCLSIPSAISFFFHELPLAYEVSAGGRVGTNEDYRKVIPTRLQYNRGSFVKSIRFAAVETFYL